MAAYRRVCGQNIIQLFCWCMLEPNTPTCWWSRIVRAAQPAKKVSWDWNQRYVSETWNEVYLTWIGPICDRLIWDLSPCHTSGLFGEENKTVTLTPQSCRMGLCRNSSANSKCTSQHNSNDNNNWRPPCKNQMTKIATFGKCNWK